MNVSSILHVDVVEALRRFESHVVVSWLGSFPEVSHGEVKHSSHFLHVNDFNIIIHEQFSFIA